jgi:hypothetical protein
VPLTKYTPRSMGLASKADGEKTCLHELLQHFAQVGELVRKAVDAGAPLRIGFGLQTVDQTVVEALQQGVELGAERSLCRCGPSSRIDREAPGRGARCSLSSAANDSAKPAIRSHLVTSR